MLGPRGIFDESTEKEKCRARIPKISEDAEIVFAYSRGSVTHEADASSSQIVTAAEIVIHPPIQICILDYPVVAKFSMRADKEISWGKLASILMRA